MRAIKKVILSSVGACLLVAASLKSVDVVQHNKAANQAADSVVGYQFAKQVDTFLALQKDTVLESPKEVTAAKVSDSAVAHYISDLYKSIKFGKNKVLSKVAFSKAYYGYLNLISAGKLNNDNVLSVCDFSLASTQKRLWVIDLERKKVLFNTYVAHGKNSGGIYARSFSNKNESHKSSLGFYVTGDTYNGSRGRSLRLNGVDQGYNDAALDRSVVLHGSNFVGEKYVAKTKKLGRSFGCPAVSNEVAQPIINDIRGGTCLFIYYPEKKYLKSTQWLKKKVQNLPSIASM